MPGPTTKDMHVDAALSSIAIAYNQDQFVADQLFPAVEVEKQSDKFYVWDKGAFLRNAVEERTPGDLYPEGRLKLSNDSYSCAIYHLAYPITDEDRDNADPAVQSDRVGAEWLARQLRLNRELKIATSVFSTGVWETDVVGGTDFTVWSDYTNSNPITDVDTGKETVRQATGIEPNTLVIGQQVYNKLKQHPDLINLFKYSGNMNGVLQSDQIRDALGVERLVIGKAVSETSNEGDSTPTRSYIWGKDALLCYVPDKPGIMVPAAGYTFLWKVSGTGLSTVVSNIRQDSRDRDLLKGKQAFDHKVTCTDLGYFLSGAIA